MSILCSYIYNILREPVPVPDGAWKVFVCISDRMICLVCLVMHLAALVLNCFNLSMFLCVEYCSTVWSSIPVLV